MRVLSIIKYIYIENIDKYKNTLEYRIYIEDKFLSDIYIIKHIICASCSKQCYTASCYLSKYISKIKYNRFINYRFYCRNLNLYFILEIDHKLIKW